MHARECLGLNFSGADGWHRLSRIPRHRETGPAATCLKQRAGIFDGVALKW